MPRAPTSTDIFNAVAESRRRDILVLLAPGERAVNDIVAATGLPQPSVSKHLKVLRQVGLVHARRDGRRMLYRTRAVAIQPLHAFTSVFERYWEGQLSRIQATAEHRAAERQLPPPTAKGDPRDGTDRTRS